MTLHVCLFGKTEAVEAIALGPAGADPAMAQRFVRHAPLPEALWLERGEHLVRVSRHRDADTVFTWIGLYGPAAAIGSSRPGSFHGAALVCIDTIVPGDAALAFLDRAAGELRKRAMQGDAFIKHISALNLSFDFDGISRELTPRPHRGGGLDPAATAEAFVDLAGATSDRIALLIDSAQAGLAARDYASLYLGGSPRLAALAARAGLTTRIVVRPAAAFDPATAPPVQPAPSAPAPALTLRDVERTIDRRIAEFTAPAEAPRRHRAPSGWDIALLTFQLLLATAVAALAWKVLGLSE